MAKFSKNLELFEDPDSYRETSFSNLLNETRMGKRIMHSAGLFLLTFLAPEKSKKEYH